MATHRAPAIAPLLLAATLAGCAQSQPITAHAVLTSKADFVQGKLTPVNHFTDQDIALLALYLSWPDGNADLGRHRLHFTWTNGEQTAFTRVLHPDLHSSPMRITAFHPAITLGTGLCHVTVTLDHKPIVDQDFTVGGQ